MTNEHDEHSEHDKLRDDAADISARRPVSFPTDSMSTDGVSTDSMSTDGVSRNGTGAEGPDDDYLLTAYLFGDITQAGKDEVERRLEESDTTRAEMDRLRSTKALIEDALKGPFAEGEGEDEESAPGRKVDPHEIAALLRARRRSRRMKTAISWLSIAATVVIAATLILPTISSGRHGADLASAPGIGITNVSSESAVRLEENDDLAYAPAGEPATGPAAGGGDTFRYFQDKDAGTRWSAPDNVGARTGNKPAARTTGSVDFEPDASSAYRGAPADRDGAQLAQKAKKAASETQLRSKMSTTESRSIPLETDFLKQGSPIADSPEHVEITEQARSQVWQFAPELEITNMRAPQVQDPPEKRSEVRSRSSRGSGAGLRVANDAVAKPTIPESAPESEVVRGGASGLPGRTSAPTGPQEAASQFGRQIELTARQRIDSLAKNEATGKDFLAQKPDARAVDAAEQAEERNEAFGDQRLLGGANRRGGELEGLASQLDDDFDDLEPASPDESLRRFGNYEAKRPGEPPSEAGAARLGDERWRRAEQQARREKGLAQVAQQQEGREPRQQLRHDIERKLRELATNRSDDYGANASSDARSSLRAAGKGVAPETPAPPERADGLDNRKRDATAPDPASTETLRDFGTLGVQGDVQQLQQNVKDLKQDIKTYARRGNQTAGGSSGPGGAGGQIVLERASEIADLVNNQQVRLFGWITNSTTIPSGDVDADSQVFSVGGDLSNPRDANARLGVHDWLSRLDAGYHNAQREIGPLEKELRAYVHYRSLDENLTLERYSARPLDVPPPAIGDENLGRDLFRERYRVNPFVDTRRDHFSTFSMDVDTASFTRARERIRSGQLPDPASVRVEEFVNYFPQDCAPDPEAVFSVCTEGGPAPFGTGLDLLKITVKARDLRPNERKGAVLTFAIDTSGSMHMESSLDLMRDSLGALVESLRADDQVAIVAYNTNAYVALPHTPAREKERILAALGSLKASGGTNVQGGLDLAYRLADEVLQPKAVNRVILCSDGVANVGARDPKEVVEKVKVFAGRGIYLSVVGFGKKRYNDSFLERLAGDGNGNYTYVANLTEARAVFQKNLPATLQVLAEDAKIQLDFNPDVVAHYRLLGYENRDIADKDFRNDKIDAAEVGPGTTVTVLYEIHRRPGSHGDLGRLFIRYRDTGTRKIDELDFSLPPGVLETRIEATSPGFRFTACAAETAELLRGSYWARDGSLGGVLDRLYSLEESFRARPEWRELAQLVTEAQRLLVIRVASEAGR